jgi:hypothetical protein
MRTKRLGFVAVVAFGMFSTPAIVNAEEPAFGYAFAAPVWTGAGGL